MMRKTVVAVGVFVAAVVALSVGPHNSVPSSFAVAASATATATPLPGPNAFSCTALDKTCSAVDTKFTPTSSSINLKTSGSTVTGSFTCKGTTTNKPTKAAKCDGEALGGSNGETSPTQPCSLTIGSTTLTTDDWSETISASGQVSEKCTWGGTDKK
jgi:hypothetical protein